jgi:deazaflavin-dependent oxidoreductase (nitroreductase family)
MRAIVLRWRRVGLWLASQGWFKSIVGPSLLTKLDRFLIDRTGRSITTPSTSGDGLPIMNLTATGAKSGEARTVPLAYLNDAGAIYVVGTNWGRTDHPSWTANLLAHPDAQMKSAEWSGPVRAERLDDAATSEVWPRLVEHLPNWEQYRHEITGRGIRVFRLHPQ